MTKISQLADIGANLAPDDEFIIRDVSDGSTPNKKVTASGFFNVATALGLAGLDRITAGSPVASGTQTRVYASGISGYSETTIVGVPSARTTISGYFENASGVASGVFFPVVTQTDIGAAPNQLSLNGMLGDLAFQNAAAVTLGTVSIDLGTVAAPSFSFNGDSDTGFYSPGANQWAVVTSGTERLRVDNNGQIEAGSLGTAAAPTWSFVGDPNTGIYSPGADQLAISTSGVQRVLIRDLSQDTVRITGTNATVTADSIASSFPGFRLASAGTAFAGFDGEAGTKATLQTFSAIPLVLGTNSGERARIDSSGRLLVGTSTARTGVFYNGDADANPILQIERSGDGASTASTGIGIIRNTNVNAGGNLIFARSAGTTSGSVTAVGINAVLGRLSYQGADGSDFVEAAAISADVDGTPGSNDMPGRLVFSTTADGASSPTEAMRINNQRELLIGTTSRTANGGVLQVSNGITFPATQSACTDPNTLDDYEEGTWTPTVIGTSTAGTASYTTQVGIYTKVGRLVHFSLYLDWNSGTGTGNLRISGLPFTANSSSAGAALSIGFFYGLTFAANNYLMAGIVPSNSQLELRQGPTGGTNDSAVTYDAAAGIGISGFYYV